MDELNSKLPENEDKSDKNKDNEETTLYLVWGAIELRKFAGYTLNRINEVLFTRWKKLSALDGKQECYRTY